MIASLHVPSRLKGIETLRKVFGGALRFLCLHVPSRLKGIETIHRNYRVFCSNSLHVPSRLKGIETRAVFFKDRMDRVYMCLPV